MVRAASPERVEHLNAALWTYGEASFLPHGSARDGNPAMQPIWLTHLDENPNGASMIVLLDGLEAEDIGGLPDVPISSTATMSTRSRRRGAAGDAPGKPGTV